jgi:phage terminase small subunit
MELEGRRELFCREYIKGDIAGRGKLNGTQAAIRAGFSPDSARSQASRMLAEDEVQDRIAELADERNKKLELDANDIIIELLRMLTADPLNYVDEDGNVLSLRQMPVDARRAVKEFYVDTTGTGVVTRTHVKFWSKEKAAELLGKHLTLFKEVLKVEGLDELAERIYAARKRDDVRSSAESLV